MSFVAFLMQPSELWRILAYVTARTLPVTLGCINAECTIIVATIFFFFWLPINSVLMYI